MQCPPSRGRCACVARSFMRLRGHSLSCLLSFFISAAGREGWGGVPANEDLFPTLCKRIRRICRGLESGQLGEAIIIFIHIVLGLSWCLAQPRRNLPLEGSFHLLVSLALHAISGACILCYKAVASSHLHPPEPPVAGQNYGWAPLWQPKIRCTNIAPLPSRTASTIQVCGSVCQDPTCIKLSAAWLFCRGARPSVTNLVKRSWVTEGGASKDALVRIGCKYNPMCQVYSDSHILLMCMYSLQSSLLVYTSEGLQDEAYRMAMQVHVCTYMCVCVCVHVWGAMQHLQVHSLPVACTTAASTSHTFKGDTFE